MTDGSNPWHCRALYGKDQLRVTDDSKDDVAAQVGGPAAVHGSAVFQGGETQVAASATVANTDARDMPIGDDKPLFVHYTLPLFAASEVRSCPLVPTFLALPFE